MRSRCVKFGVIILTLSPTGLWKFNMASHCIRLVAWLSSQKEASSKDDAHVTNSVLRTNRLRTWIAGTISCGVMKPRYTYLVQMVSSECSSNLVRSTKQVCLSYSQAWWSF
ncbi:hypothetical protein ILYODFUR_002783 [Ilyodon furcidens]|uniref:Secreted protein n=1 Tax=Ilyodon furcidens TaxID=33524 RepID=A0ABV0UCX0_9TELE